MAIGKVCFTESPRRQDTAPTCLYAGFIFLSRCGTGGFNFILNKDEQLLPVLFVLFFTLALNPAIIFAFCLEYL